jgi:hypothetical protein
LFCVFGPNVFFLYNRVPCPTKSLVNAVRRAALYTFGKSIQRDILKKESFVMKPPRSQVFFARFRPLSRCVQSRLVCAGFAALAVFFAAGCETPGGAPPNAQTATPPVSSSAQNADVSGASSDGGFSDGQPVFPPENPCVLGLPNECSPVPPRPAEEPEASAVEEDACTFPDALRRHCSQARIGARSRAQNGQRPISGLHRYGLPTSTAMRNAH